MNPIYQSLFDTYGDSLLRDAELYCEEEINQHLAGLSLDDHALLTIDNLFFDCYYQWSTAAFAAGLHLGLSLLRDQVRRPGPQ